VGFWVPAERRRDAEWMDADGNGRDALAPTLRDLRRVNRLLGGRAALLSAVRPRVEAIEPGGTFRMLDVGTGEGDLPRAVVDLAGRLGRRAEIVAIDRDPTVAALAAERCAGVAGIRVLRADALALPFAAGTFDVACASLFLHHFDDGAAVRVLREMARVARGGAVINDLRRHRVPWAFTAALGRLRLLSPMSRNDGPLSVLKGFTAAELLALGRAATGAARVRTSWGFRLVLEVDPP